MKRMDRLPVCVSITEIPSDSRKSSRDSMAVFFLGKKMTNWSHVFFYIPIGNRAIGKPRCSCRAHSVKDCNPSRVHLQNASDFIEIKQDLRGRLFRRARGGEFLEARIIPERIEHGIEPKQRGVSSSLISARSAPSIEAR